MEGFCSVSSLSAATAIAAAFFFLAEPFSDIKSCFVKAVFVLGFLFNLSIHALCLHFYL